MTLYIVKRLILALFTLLAILSISYLLLRLSPGDPAKSSMMSMDSGMGTVSSEKGEFSGNRSIRESLYLDKPIFVGFALWLKNVVCHGDFGNSVSVDPGRPVALLILDRMPITLYLNSLAIIVCYILAIFCGIISAVKIDTITDRSIALSSFILYSLPGIWVALLLQTLFCEGGKYPIFPLKGIGVDNREYLSTFKVMGLFLFNSILPVFCLAYAGIAGLSRYMRSSMAEILNQEYIRTARAKGAGEFDVIMHHAFRNAVITLITLFAGLLPSLIAGSVIVEYVFNIPGMGSLSMAALSGRDYPLQMALFAITGALTLSGILLADLLYIKADPRINLSGSGS